LIEEEASMKSQAKNSDEPLYRYLHEMTEEQLVAALHELADRIDGHALIASKKHANKRLAARIFTALEARENEDGEQQ
jgi:hypothetical protein